MSDISLAIFDLGNVLYPVRLDRAFAKLSRYSGLPVKHFADRSILDDELRHFHRIFTSDALGWSWSLVAWKPNYCPTMLALLLSRLAA